MLKHMPYVALYVSDQDKALDFYTNILGFEKRIEAPGPAPRFVSIGVNGQAFELILWPGTPGRGQAVQGRTPAQYTIEVEDCRKTYETLKPRGVKFVTEVLEYPWGYVALFEDPDGNVLQIREGRQPAAR